MRERQREMLRERQMRLACDSLATVKPSSASVVPLEILQKTQEDISALLSKRENKGIKITEQ